MKNLILFALFGVITLPDTDASSAGILEVIHKGGRSAHKIIF